MGRFKNMEPKKRQLYQSEVQNLLEEEILQLQKELQRQTDVRSALEKAMKCQPVLDDPTYKLISQASAYAGLKINFQKHKLVLPAENLIKEIALLEVEVAYLEKYLLSIYRRSSVKHLLTLPIVNEAQNPKLEADFVSVNKNLTDIFPKKSDCLGTDALVDTGIYRSHSSLSERSACSFRSSLPFEGFAKVVDSYHSLPLSMLERKQEAASNVNLAEYIGSGFPDIVWEKLNFLSEEMIKCISTIYCHLSDNAFNAEESKEFNGSNFQMVEVRDILRDPERLNAVKDHLENFRYLISRLAQVDPGKLRHEEKLAFWINVHNSLVMHAYLVYGIPRGNLKRISLVLKAAYNIGGHTISVETIQSSILRYRLPRPAQWLQSLFFSKAKFKTGDPRKAYAIKYPEPRLRFALCSGCQSDAAVSVYTSKRVFQELEIAKEEYIKMNIRLHKEQRLVVPKNIEYFIKEMELSQLGIEEMFELSMPDFSRTNFQHLKEQRFWKKVDWIPHNFNFRFLLSCEVLR